MRGPRMEKEQQKQRRCNKDNKDSVGISPTNEMRKVRRKEHRKRR